MIDKLSVVIDITFEVVIEFSVTFCVVARNKRPFLSVELDEIVSRPRIRS